MGRDFTGTIGVDLDNWLSSTRRLPRSISAGPQPVGQQLAQGRNVPVDTEIIGVFGDAHYHDVRGEIPRQTFVNMDSRIDFVNALNVYARIQGDPRAIMPSLRAQVGRVDADLVISDMRMMDEQVDRRLANERMLSFPLWRICLARHDPGGRGPAWRARVHRGAANARDRHSRRPRRSASGVIRLVVREMLLMILARTRRGERQRGAYGRKLGRDAASWRQSGGLVGVRAERDHAADGRAYGLVPAGAARIADSSDACPASRVRSCRSEGRT